MKLYIKNMVCNRCKMVIQESLETLGLHPIKVDLGEVVIAEKDIIKIKPQLDEKLEELGFELLNDNKSKSIEKIKNLITKLIQSKSQLNHTLSSYLQEELHQDYSSLSNLFSSVEGITVEKYYILQRIEKVKELLVYGELTLSEIAHEMHYSSVAYLSNQFKKITGLSPSRFKKMGNGKRKPLDEL